MSISSGLSGLQSLDGAVLQGTDIFRVLEQLESRRDLGDERYLRKLQTGAYSHTGVYEVTSEEGWQDHTTKVATVADRTEAREGAWEYMTLAPITRLTLRLSVESRSHRMPDQRQVSTEEAVWEYVLGAIHLSSSAFARRTPLPHLRQLTLVSERRIGNSRPAVRLFFSSPPSPGARLLRYITGSLDSSPFHTHLSNLLRGQHRHQRSFTIHLDPLALVSNFQVLTLRMPVPASVQHLRVTFPLLEPEEIMCTVPTDRTREFYSNDRKGEMQHWITQFALWVRRRARLAQAQQSGQGLGQGQAGSVLLEIVGAYAYMDQVDRLLHSSSGHRHLDGGGKSSTPHVQIKDRTWQYIGKELERLKIIAFYQKFDNREEAIDSLTTPGRYGEADVYLTFKPCRADGTCEHCGQQHALEDPFSVMSDIPWEEARAGEAMASGQHSGPLSAYKLVCADVPAHAQ